MLKKNVAQGLKRLSIDESRLLRVLLGILENDNFIDGFLIRTVIEHNYLVKFNGFKGINKILTNLESKGFIEFTVLYHLKSGVFVEDVGIDEYYNDCDFKLDVLKLSSVYKEFISKKGITFADGIGLDYRTVAMVLLTRLTAELLKDPLNSGLDIKRFSYDECYSLSNVKEAIKMLEAVNFVELKNNNLKVSYEAFMIIEDYYILNSNLIRTYENAFDIF